jgi:RecB family endonuclease NucS
LKAFTKPSLEEAHELIQQAIREKIVALLVGQCIVNYFGRAGSVLPQGERIVIMKPDGTLLVHKKDKREPVNWNPPGCIATTKLTKEGLQIFSYRQKPKETLLVLFKELKLLATFDLVDEEDLYLVGSEKDLIDMVFNNPSLIEDGLKPIEREKMTRYGAIDLYCIDRDGNGVVMEFKRGRAELAGVSQLKRYVDEIKERYEKSVRGILVAPNITSSAMKLLKEYGLEYVRISKPPTHTFERVVTRDRGQKALREF